MIVDNYIAPRTCTRIGAVPYFRIEANALRGVSFQDSIGQHHAIAFGHNTTFASGDSHPAICVLLNSRETAVATTRETALQRNFVAVSSAIPVSYAILRASH